MTAESIEVLGVAKSSRRFIDDLKKFRQLFPLSKAWVSLSGNRLVRVQTSEPEEACYWRQHCAPTRRGADLGQGGPL